MKMFNSTHHILCSHQCVQWPVTYTIYLFYFLLLESPLSPLCLTPQSHLPAGIIHTCIILVSTRVGLKGQLARRPAGRYSPISNSRVCSGVCSAWNTYKWKHFRDILTRCRSHVASQYGGATAWYRGLRVSPSNATSKVHQELCLMAFLFPLWSGTMPVLVRSLHPTIL